MKKKYAVILVDTENVISTATSFGKVVDWAALRDFFLEKVLVQKEEILFSSLYLSPGLAVSLILQNAEAAGFSLRLCQRTKEDKDTNKDMVDDRIKRDILKYLLLSDVGHIVIVSDDGHMADAVSDTLNRRRKITVVGTRQVSGVLKAIAGLGRILTSPTG